MIDLPRDFKDKMRDLIGDEYEAYIASLSEPAQAGLRVNTSKISVEVFTGLIPFDLKPVPWCQNGFYYDADSERPAAHPLYHCGLYYIQEPSAMAPASFLPVKAGERVLDLCAAPGGKTTQLALSIQESGLLVSNDISASRTKALLKNIELWGLKNTVVTCESPARLAEVFPGYFDKILIDAPCSGEGMFRRGGRMVKAWEEHGPSYFAPIQRQITEDALRMLKPGGMLLYSTCTFDPSEDEEVIDHIREIAPEMKILPLPDCEGFVSGFERFAPHDPEGIKNCRRLFPHRVKGDGHFAALLQKEPDKDEMPDAGFTPYEEEQDRVIEQTLGKGKAASVMVTQVPSMIADLPDIRFKRAGLLLGQKKAGRMIPGQAYAMTLKKGDYEPALNLGLQDERTGRYLRGESIEILKGDDLPPKGTVLILIEGYPAGWGTISGLRIKNNLLPGWRVM